MTDPDVPKPIVRDKDPRTFYPEGNGTLASVFEFREDPPPDARTVRAGQPVTYDNPPVNFGAMSGTALEKALADDAAIAKFKAETIHKNEREIFDKKLDVVNRLSDELLENISSIGRNIRDIPELWQKLTQVANLSLEIAMAQQMATIAFAFGIDAAWLAGLPALMAKKGIPLTVRRTATVSASEMAAANAAPVPAPQPTDVQRAVTPVVDDSPLNVGDVVVLNSSPMRMTVEKLTADCTEVMCMWFTDAADLKRQTFPTAAVRRA